MNVHIHIPENAAQIIANHIARLIAVPNTQHDFGEFIGWLNNRESRDSYAIANNMWNYRFDENGIVHGIWYCCMKRSQSQAQERKKKDGHSHYLIGIYHGFCELCTKEHFIQEFGYWSSENTEIDKVIQESQENKQLGHSLQWIPYDNFRDIKHIADGGYGSVYSAILKNGVKIFWDYKNMKWKYNYVGNKVALKEINDSRHDISKFLKEVKNLMITNDWLFIAKFHRDLHSGNILIRDIESYDATITDLGLCRFADDFDLIKSDNKSNIIYGSIPYIPPEVLRGYEFTKKGDIYSFGGIMYEIATGKQPFYDRAHDTRLIIDICNGIRPKIPDIMLDWIPQFYSDLMYKCWNGDPSKRPSAKELYDAFNSLKVELHYNEGDNIFRQFKIADENQKEAIKYQKQELLELFLSSSESHSQSCYISRSIHTLHGLYNSLEDIKSGKSQDPNLLKSNTSSVSTYDIDSKESQECIDWENEIQK
ncbi:hypothetical protein Glove_311g21 [Diversispora epigaea]|uniref:Protein kinase domain-containing protein n=1 Tax=Diversispora epigaea TaxID=1348612 RepID=A0A397HRF8_9GLOM|nr:hypothetical protein Glove_311g21 [Diversispora epigaea]